MMTKETEAAYWRWIKAANVCPKGTTYPAVEVQRQQRIVALKTRYEAMLARDKAAGKVAQ